MSEGGEEPPFAQRKRRGGQRTAIPQSTARRNLSNAPPTEAIRSRSGSRIRVKKPTPKTTTTVPREDDGMNLTASVVDTAPGTEVSKRRRSEVSSPDSPSQDSERRPPWKYQTLAAPPSPSQSTPLPPQLPQSQPPLQPQSTSLPCARPPSTPLPVSPSSSSRLLQPTPPPSSGPPSPPVSRPLSPPISRPPSPRMPVQPPPPTLQQMPPSPPQLLPPPPSQPQQPFKTYPAKTKTNASETIPNNTITGNIDQTAGFSQEFTSWPRDSTSYADLASPLEPMLISRPHSPQPGPSGLSYAAAATIQPGLRKSTPPPTSTTATQPSAPRSSYPPLTVECLPNWTRHFEALRGILGHAPHAKPLGRGVRFLPKSAEEFRAIQRYLVQAASTDPTISWFCYSPETEKPTKIAIRGLPLNTPTEEIIAALQTLGFPAESARALPPPPGKHGCTYFVQLSHLSQEELRELYKIVELLHMPDIIVEAWRGGSKPPQCHRCQAFGHSSTNCHRPQRCVRCAGDHLVRDCPRSRDDVPTCANCGQNHAANDRRCTHYKREARKRGIPIPPLPPRARQAQQQIRREEAAPPPLAPPLINNTEPIPTLRPDHMQTEAVWAPTTLAPPANPPTERGQALRKRNKRQNRKARPVHTEPSATSTPHPRQLREQAATGHPSTQDPVQAPTQVPDTILTQPNQPVSVPTETYAQALDRAPTQQGSLSSNQVVPGQPIRETTQRPTQANTQQSVSATTQQPIQTTANQTTQPRISRPSQRPAQVPTPVSTPNYQGQGEVQTNPDIIALVRVVIEALMTGLTAYMQGQGVVPAITAGMAVLLRHHSC